MGYDMNFSNFQNTITFGTAYPTADEFYNDYEDMMVKMGQTHTMPITDKNVMLLYWLLYAQYANSSFANYDLNQVKAKLFSIVFMYGPTWQKRTDIQLKLRAMDLDDGELFIGSKQIMNHAQNPAGTPGTSSLDEL